MCFAVKQRIKKKSELSGEWGWDSCSKSESNWQSLKTTVKYSAPRVVCTLADLHHFHPSLCFKTNFCVSFCVCFMHFFHPQGVPGSPGSPGRDGPPGSRVRSHSSSPGYWHHFLLTHPKDRQSAEFRSHLRTQLYSDGRGLSPPAPPTLTT